MFYNEDFLWRPLQLCGGDDVFKMCFSLSYKFTPIRLTHLSMASFMYFAGGCACRKGSRNVTRHSTRSGCYAL